MSSHVVMNRNHFTRVYHIVIIIKEFCFLIFLIAAFIRVNIHTLLVREKHSDLFRHI